MPDRFHAQEFAGALLFSLQSDAGYRALSSGDGVYKTDFGALSFVQIAAVAPDGLGRFCDAVKSFSEQMQHRAENRRCMRSFFVVMYDCTQGGALERDSFYMPALKRSLQDCERQGMLAEFILIDLYSHSYSVVPGRQPADKKIRKILADLLSAEKPGELEKRVDEKRREILRRSTQAEKIREVRPVNPLAFLILINALIFLFDAYFAFKYGYKPLETIGIQDNRLILQGEIWRLFTPMFLHAGAAHIAGNMISLFYLGTIALDYYTVREFFAIYLISGFVGNLLSFFFVDALSLGASGAIMGLGGMLIYRMFFGKYAKAFRLAGNYAIFAVMVIFNLFFGVFAINTNINNFCHFGGFAAGFLVTAAIAAIRDHKKKRTAEK